MAEGGGRPRTAPLLGRVTDASGQPQGDIEVRLAWQETDSYRPPSIAMPRGPAGEAPSEWTIGSEESRTTVETTTDSRGIFLLCDVPHGSTLRLDVTRSDGVSASRRALVPVGAEVAIVTVTIGPR